MLHKAADFYEREATSMVERLTSLLEPAIIVAVGGVVGTIVFSVFLPLYQILGAIR
jgi:type IV pilus assembly protein PilC